MRNHPLKEDVQQVGLQAVAELTGPEHQDNIEKIKFNNKEYPIGSIQLEYNNEITLGFEICRDSWDNERPANYIKTKKNLIIFNPIASHYAFKKFDFRKDLVIKSSKKFNCTYMSVNLLGNESGKIIFEGDSILAQKGKLLDISKRFSFEDFSINFNTINLEEGNKKYNEIYPNWGEV